MLLKLVKFSFGILTGGFLSAKYKFVKTQFSNLWFIYTLIQFCIKMIIMFSKLA